jgi:hypothetical protein
MKQLIDLQRAKLFPCAKCGRKHGRLRSNGRPESYCQLCHAAYMRANRPQHVDLSDEQRRRANVRSYANVYLRRGLLTKQPCEGKRGGRRCMRRNVQMHHDDYSKPLDVRWLCPDCNREHHRTHR